MSEGMWVNEYGISLSVDDMDADIQLGMVGDEWHGPKPPGADWVAIQPGPRGGKRWKRSGQAPAQQQVAQPVAQQPAAKSSLSQQKIAKQAAPAKVAKGAKPVPADKKQVIGLMQAATVHGSPQNILAAINGLMGLKLAEMREVVTAIGSKAKGRSKDEVAKLVQKEIEKMVPPKPTPQPPILPQVEKQVGPSPTPKSASQAPAPKQKEQPKPTPQPPAPQQTPKPGSQAPSPPRPMKAIKSPEKAASGMSASQLAKSSDFKPMKTHTEQIEFLKKLGVKEPMLSSRAVEQSNAVCQALQSLKAMGHEMPDAVIVSGSWFAQNAPNSAGQMGKLPDGGYVVAINPDNPMNQLGGAIPAWSHQQGHTSTDDPLHTVVHEMGHLQHAKNAPKMYQNTAAARVFSDGFSNLSPKAQAQVSNYGRTKMEEFVAETFAGMALGREYDKEVVDLYDKLGGKRP